MTVHRKDESHTTPQYDMENDLPEVWRKVVADYEQVTKQRLDPNTNFDSFQLTVNTRLREASSKRTGNARKILNHLGLCLQQFGGIVATAASVVFAPSAQCWNAINFVIMAAQKYSDVLDGFVTLMEHCAAFLSRLNVFLEQEVGNNGSFLPPHLRKPAYDILAGFVDILKSSYKLSKSTREKLRIILDVVVFSGDAGVSESMQLFEERVQAFTKVQIDQILLDVRGLARHLEKSEGEIKAHQAEIREHQERTYGVMIEALSITKELKSTLDGKMSQEKHERDLKSIRDAIDPKGDFNSWTKRQDYISKRRMKESGQWIIDNKFLAFSAWTTARDVDTPTKILVVEGDHGFGKSYITNKVVSHLRNTHPSNASSTRTSIAYYYFGEDREDSLETCLRSIVYQFASTNPAYAGAVAETCRLTSDISRAIDIWQALIRQIVYATKKTYYVCIDGFEIGDTAVRAGETLSTITENILFDRSLPIQFCFAGPQDATRYLPQSKLGVAKVLLGPVKYVGADLVPATFDTSANTPTASLLINAHDLRVYASAKLEDMAVKKPDLKDFITDAHIAKLISGVHGNYEHLQSKLVQINSCDTQTAVLDVIDSIGDDWKTSIRGFLARFSDSLSAAQIEQLNEILVWVVDAKKSSIEFLQSALYSRFGETFMLKGSIATTFSQLLSVDEEGQVKFKSDQFLQILREERQNYLRFSHTDSSTLSQAEINLCSCILRNVCGQDVYNRFKFDDYFNVLAGKHRASVQIPDENNLNVVITNSLLLSLCKSREIPLDQFRAHASIWFYEHLSFFVEKLDYFEPDTDILRTIGSNLSHVLYDREAISTWMMGDMETIKCDFIVGDSEDVLEPMLKALRNPHVARGYTDDEEKKIWIESVIGTKGSKYAILERVAGTLAERWFRSEVLLDLNYLWIPYGIFSRATTRGVFDEGDERSLPQIVDFMQWIQDKIHLEITDPIYIFRAGAAYRFLGNNKEALRMLQGIESKLATNWAFLLSLAEIHADLKEYPTALNYLDLIKRLPSNSVASNSELQKYYWERVAPLEGQCYYHTKDYEAAVKCYQHILDQNTSDELVPAVIHRIAMDGLFSSWAKTGTHDSIVAFLREVRDTGKAGKSLLYWFGEIISSMDSINGHIIRASQVTNSIGEVCAMYDSVIQEKPVVEDTSAKVAVQAEVYLRCYRAALRFYGSTAHCDHEEALESWATLALNPGNEWYDYWVGRKAVRLLAPALLEKGIDEYSSSGALKSSLSNRYTSKLEELLKSSQQTVRDQRQGHYDPTFCLVRLHVLENREELAVSKAKGLLQGAFDGWPDTLDDPSSSLAIRITILAQILTIFDLGDDAVAAWQILKPRGITDSLQTSENMSTGLDHATTTKDASTLQMTSSEQHGIAAAEAHLSNYTCDGCSEEWKTMLADCWVCKNCLCVQLCSLCHQKLLAEKLNPLVCSSKHTFLYLPKFDDAAWSSVPEDMVLVGGRLLARNTWLNTIRVKWGMTQEQIDVSKLEKARRYKAGLLLIRFLSKVSKNRSTLLAKKEKAATFPAIHAR